MTGPSASGSEYGTPSSMMSTPTCGQPQLKHMFHAIRIPWHQSNAHIVKDAQGLPRCIEVRVASANKGDESHSAKRINVTCEPMRMSCRKQSADCQVVHALSTVRCSLHGRRQSIGGGSARRLCNGRHTLEPLRACRAGEGAGLGRKACPGGIPHAGAGQGRAGLECQHI